MDKKETKGEKENCDSCTHARGRHVETEEDPFVRWIVFEGSVEGIDEERIKITVFDEREGLPFLLSRIIISASDLSFPFLRLATKLIRLARESPSNVALFEASLKRGANSAKTFRHNGGRETTVTLLREIRIESSFSSWKIFISSKI